VGYDLTKGREFARGGYRPAMGKSTMRATCPFCGTGFIIFLWSLSGTGKKCPKCGAMHGSTGMAYPVVKGADIRPLKSGQE
jgi:ribosomal protein S27AE